jgi:hypothetical protein
MNARTAWTNMYTCSLVEAEIIPTGELVATAQGHSENDTQRQSLMTFSLFSLLTRSGKR